MKLKLASKNALMLAMATSFVLPQFPHHVKASPKVGTMDLFSGDTGLFPTTPTIPGAGNNSGSGNGGGNKPKSNPTPTTPTTPTPAKTQGSTSMSPAKVPQAYSCPLFENRPHAELISAVESLMTVVKTSPECGESTSAQSIETNSKALKENIDALQGLIEAPDASTLNTGALEKNVTAAMGALNNLGDVLNSNAFLNSKCGRQTMSTGQALLAFNDMINGLAPYALFAVSANAALAPALPFVVGGAIATTGISVFAKMVDQGTLDMESPVHRTAVLQNTCQFTKVAKKVRFMQLAQSGKIDKITQELEKTVNLYKARFSSPSRELSALLKYRQTVTDNLSTIEKQLASDINDMTSVNAQLKINNDDLMVCTLGRELVSWAQDGKTFPFSAFANLEAAASGGDRSLRLQAVTLKALNNASMIRIVDSSNKSAEDESQLKLCAQTARTWIAGIQQAVNATQAQITTSKTDLEAELSLNSEYRQFKAQYAQIQVEQTTIKRVEKAMQELAKDNSIIDRSELEQRMVLLKAGLFGTNKTWGLGKPPVLAWIDHTKLTHDRAVSNFIFGMKSLKAGSYSMTETGKGQAVKRVKQGSAYTDPRIQVRDIQISEKLGNFNLKTLPQGSRSHEVACQQLESAWLDWSASLDHLGAIQFFCDMIDPVLDVKMDTSVVKACRGLSTLGGKTYSLSIVNQAKKVLVTEGYQADASIVSKKLKELECPLPAVSVMNQ